ncbi:MAG TPA: WYL domain-containing protein [Chloroflexota bacterium]|nr:WYL domain-containing protein [Chloroflexota bacterium]
MRTAPPRKRLVADRFRRVWAIVEYIATHPGCTRRALADHFAVAERTLQADLNTIRYEMGLPLTRRGGYRFVSDDGPGARSFGLPEAYLLARALEQAATGPAGAVAVRALAAKLPALLPIHLRPLLRLTLAGALASGAEPVPDAVLGVLAQAMQRGAGVRLRYGAEASATFAVDPVLDPELVVPYQGGWYLIGQCRQTRTVRMYPLDSVQQASLVAPQRR